MRGARGVLVLCCASVLASGCATRGSVSRVRADLASLRTQLDELRQAQDRLTLELARMAADLRAGQARLSSLGPEVGQTTAALKTLTARVDATEARVTRLQTTVEQVEREPPRAPTPVSLSVPAPERARAVEPAPPADPAARVYAAALEQYQGREYGQAVLDLLDFIAKYPRHPLANNAQYWIGEAYYVQHDYRQAALEFRKVFESDPRGNKVPDAILKVGLCQLQLHQPSRAQELWRRLVRDYPDSEAAHRARSLLGAPGVSFPAAR